MTKKKKVRRWFGRLKGHGFMHADEESVDVFVHYAVEDESVYSGLHEPENEKKRNKRSRRR